MEWTNKTIGDIAFVTKLAGFEHTKYIQGNCTHERKDDSFIPLFIGKTVRDGRIDKNFDWYIPKSIADQLPRSFLKRKCLVLPYVGTIGDLAVFDASYDALLGSNIAKIELNPNCGYSEEFIYYYLKSPRGQTVLLKDEQGGIQKNITMEAIRNVLLPDVDENNQKKIVSVLSALDDKIALNKKMNQKLEAMAKRLYDYWFVQYDFPDKNGRPYKTTGGPMTYNPTLKREIPEGWGVKSLFDCSDVLYGFPYATEPFDEENLDTSTKPYPVIRIRDIKDNTISAKTTETVDDKYRTKVNDLLIGMDGYFHMSFWPRNDDYVNQRITRIRQKELSVMIIYHQIAPFIKFKEDQAKGSTVGHLSDKDMKQINILVPNNPRLSEKFDSILNLITKNKQKIYRLTKLRDKLLPLLMNGQVEVE
ncbi:type I restriction enzyme, S subunit [Fibrobacter sp. UWB16]|uniref:restriction endonuclease subunit S n=1 Tax=Fibrobacter sp. UWB16 TaxID=1945874 RepID=UPI000BD072D2|nr:restriction endonuclease subunit S [Fibrobacter sp. UWB16]SOD17327.1 type I restriction enzyme, S subunit [Fibrobacter sp. UWB16]